MRSSLLAMLLVLAATGNSWGQSSWQPAQAFGAPQAQPLPPGGTWTADGGVAHSPLPETGSAVGGCSHCGSTPLGGSCPACGDSRPLGGSQGGSFASRWFAAQEYLLLRTHFSEALAFARIRDSVGAGGFERSVRAEELDFDYESSFRSVLGYHWNDCTDIRFTYWHLDVDTRVNGTAGVGETIVDPYGGYALTGQDISATAAVKMNVYDLEVVRPVEFRRPNLGLDYSAGLRFADVEQFSGATVRNAGAIASAGQFEAEFFGVGPYFTVAGELTAPRRKRFSLLAKSGMALLVGQYDVSTQMRVPGVMSGGQEADRTRMVPVAEAELGGEFRATDYLTFSAGWLFQGWWNIGASGGTFDLENTPLAATGDAAFVGTDDSDIMSFDGLFLRAELEF